MDQLLKLMEDWKGYVPVRGARPVGWEGAVASVIELVENHKGLPLRRWQFELEEAMGTDSFPLLFADALDRQMLAGFQGVGTPLDPIFRRSQVADFRTVKRFRHEGMIERMPIVGEKGEYTLVEETEGEFSYALSKYGRRTALSWETLLNDDLNAFSRFPANLAQSALNTQAWFQTYMLLDANGPRSAFFAAGLGQAAVSVLTLTVANLGTAVAEQQAYQSLRNEPILNAPRYLVVGPSQEINARTILTSAQLAWTDGTSTGELAHGTANALKSYGLQLIVDPWIPVVANSATTTWYLVADPSQIAPAEFGQLRGHSSPELFIQDSDQRRVGGGGVSPMDGSFHRDMIEYKVRYCFGGCTLDERAVWGSTGAGS